MEDGFGLNATVRRTGAATGGPGSIVNTGVMQLQKRPVARSVYLRQVHEIFPFPLLGREAELAELAAFCTEPDGSAYAWWQGPAWAGKSALMAWFVQHPPAGVRVVSFFITARFADQSDRTAFLEVMLEQLAEVAKQPVPDLLNESNRQAWFAQLLDDAAAVCRENSQRLVLVVDGLDEDRGVTSGRESHSIAALLPADPPAGVRVIVAGRPNPPVPGDVPTWHPLRDGAIVHPLGVSTHAQMIRDDAERELDYLLDDQGLGRKLLGLVTVARGGLSLDDLVELSGEPPRTVDKTLRSVLGRTFRGRLNRWRSSAPPVFVLAHEELQQSAAESLSRNEIAQFLGQLNAWADEYRGRGWPPETPEYLLRGYHRLLVSMGDIERMTEMATDRARLDRMLDVSGGDAAAMAEITAVQQFICGQRSPGLAALLGLAIMRDRLVERNKSMPMELAVAWVRLGNPFRGEALARSITSVSAQPRAFAAVATALAAIGDLKRARQLIGEAEVIARGITGQQSQAYGLAAAAEALAQVGDTDKAQVAARAITDEGALVRTLTVIAQALADAGDMSRARQVLQRAETTARSITAADGQAASLGWMATAVVTIGDAGHAEALVDSIAGTPSSAYALASLGGALGKAGDLDRARPLLRQAEVAAAALGDPFPQACALARTASALARIGDLDRARQLIQQAEAAVRSIPESSSSLRASALVDVTKALVSAGDISRAEDVARSIGGGSAVGQALAHVAEALASAGDIERAWQVAQQAELITRSGTDVYWQGRTLAAVTNALAEAGDTAQAEAVARSIPGPWVHWQTLALAGVAEALAEAGDAVQARQVTGQAEAASRSCNQFWHGSALARMATAWAACGDTDRAESTAREAGGRDVLVGVAEALARTGNADAAENTARSIADPFWQTVALAGVAGALAGTGDTDRARQLLQQTDAATQSMTGPFQQAVALGKVARALACFGDVGRARQLAQQAELAARSLTDLYEQAEGGAVAAAALAGVTTALVRAADLDQAEAVARSIGNWSEQAEALGAVAAALARAGDADRAEAIARSATDPYQQATALAVMAAALAEVPGTVGPPGNAVISATPAGERLRRLLAAILAQTGNYRAALPLLAKIDPATVIKAAQNISAQLLPVDARNWSGRE